jgi:hypothetical protein
MKKLETLGIITPTVKMPIKQGTLDFLQLAHQETAAELARAMVGPNYDATKVYALFGCELSAIGPAITVSEGAVLFNGEIYLVEPNSVTLGGGDIILWNRFFNQYTSNADPVTFTDSSLHNVHNNRQATIAAGASGAGTLTGNANSDYANTLRPEPYTSTGIVLATVGGNLWTNYGAPFYNAAYKIGSNEVALCGVATNIGIAPGIIPILTLPIGARPSSQIQLVAGAQMPTTFASAKITITTAGVVSVDSAGSTAATVFLDGLRFRIR